MQKNFLWSKHEISVLIFAHGHNGKHQRHTQIIYRAVERIFGGSTSASAFPSAIVPTFASDFACDFAFAFASKVAPTFAFFCKITYSTLGPKKIPFTFYRLGEQEKQ